MACSRLVTPLHPSSFGSFFPVIHRMKEGGYGWNFLNKHFIKQSSMFCREVTPPKAYYLRRMSYYSYSYDISKTVSPRGGIFCHKGRFYGEITSQSNVEDAEGRGGAFVASNGEFCGDRISNCEGGKRRCLMNENETGEKRGFLEEFSSLPTEKRGYFTQFNDKTGEKRAFLVESPLLPVGIRSFFTQFKDETVAKRGFASISSSGRDIKLQRNVGISAHIDSGKTTLTERILFYSGRLKSIHEIRGSDGVGAKMDFMELEREKGITIQSAATFCNWKVGDDQHFINIIDTPGHVDFTIEVERALRVLDGAILVCCAVSGVQSQTLTVERQMRRYEIPHIFFVNKLDRDGADPIRAMNMIRERLGVTTAALQIPVGVEHNLRGLIEVISRKVYYFEGKHGENVIESSEIPTNYIEATEKTRLELIEKLADVDDSFAEKYLEGIPLSEDDIHSAIRRSTIERKFCPLLMGSARTNKGVQLLLNSVCRYLPSPDNVQQFALDQDNEEIPMPLSCDPKQPLVSLAFKIQEQKLGLLTYLRIYQGILKKGDSILNVSTGKKVAAKRLLQMHSDEAKECVSAGPGDIVALSGIECSSGSTFTDGKLNVSLQSMFVPNPVVSWSLKPKQSSDISKFNKALKRFQREDPTFRVHVDEESKETVMSGMGELQLDVYVERMRREYGLELEVGEPKVNFRETITQSVDFEYQHKKQSGGAGQYGKIIGYFEPLSDALEGDFSSSEGVVFENKLAGNQITPQYITSVEKGFRESFQKGRLSGSPVMNVRCVLTDGASHPVDSSDVAFKAAATGAVREFYKMAAPIILEPIMKVEVILPAEFQSQGLSSLIRRKANVKHTETQGGNIVIIAAEVGLKDMFGYISDLRSCTQGQGEFTMEFGSYQPMSSNDQEAVVAKYQSQMQNKGNA